VFLRLLPIIRDIAASGVGILLVEQFAQLALGVADDALVVTGGRVSYHGSPDALLQDAGLLRTSYLG
jgi:branched-chain amino acid transport system ATP-binding protein